MEIEIHVLSGPGQGSSKILECKALRIGDGDDCEIHFDSSKVPEAAGQCVEIRLTDDGWKLASLGDGEVRVNQEIVEGLYQIKPGDVIRLSENGPDYSFGLVRPGMTVVEKTADSTLGEVLEDTVANVSETASRTARRYPAIAAGIVGICLLILLGLLFNRANKPDDTTSAVSILELGSIQPQRIDEEQEWKLDVFVRLENIERSAVRFELGQKAPEGMEIDAVSGQIRWTPSENQGPGQYEVTITATMNDVPGDLVPKRSTTSMKVSVNEVNRPPVADPIPMIVLTQDDDFTMKYTVQARDPDDSSTVLRYILSSPSPDGMRINVETGEIHWKPTSEQLGQTLPIMVEVREENADRLKASVPFLVRSDRPKESQGIKDAVYLLSLVDPKGRQEYAFCNAIAVGSHALVTSGVCARALQGKKESGWKVSAVQGSSGKSEQVLGILVHDFFDVLAEDLTAQIYVDIGIIVVKERKERVLLKIAGPAVLDDLKPGDPLEFLAIKYDAGPLSQFKDTHPKIYQGELRDYDMLLLSEEDKIGPTMIHMLATLPKNNYGGAVLDKKEQLLAIFAESAFSNEDVKVEGMKGLHYAPTVLLVKSWLQGDLKYWNTPVSIPEKAEQ
jgi:hypothetical protein